MDYLLFADISSTNPDNIDCLLSLPHHKESNPLWHQRNVSSTKSIYIRWHSSTNPDNIDCLLSLPHHKESNPLSYPWQQRNVSSTKSIYIRWHSLHQFRQYRLSAVFASSQRIEPSVISLTTANLYSLTFPHQSRQYRLSVVLASSQRIESPVIFLTTANLYSLTFPPSIQTI